MGLSSSQARLLNLTARMHDIEYKAQNLEAQKLQMANESRQVYQEYEDALNKQKIQLKQINTDGSIYFEDATFETLLNAGYRLKIFADGDWHTAEAVVDGELVQGEEDIKDLSSGFYMYTFPGTYNVGDIIKIVNNTVPIGTAPIEKYVKVIELPKKVQFLEPIEQLKNLNVSDKNVLCNYVEAGYIVFEKPMSDGTYSEVNIATDTNLQEVSDETALKKAEAKYEADMRKINAKDKKFDTDLSAMETERSAIKTEMDTLKNVAKDNVDRTFKLFS